MKFLILYETKLYHVSKSCEITSYPLNNPFLPLKYSCYTYILIKTEHNDTRRPSLVEMYEY